MNGVYSKGVAITASANDLALGPTDALYINTAGNITVTMGGDSLTFTVVAGEVLPFKVTKVTSGSGVTALYR